MAKIVLGIGSSHSPALLMEPPAWRARAETDDRNFFVLHDHSGARVAFDDLLERADPSLAEEIADDRMDARHAANQRAIAETAHLLADADPDLVIIIGDDHKEVFKDDNMPALSVYWGETVPYRPQGIMKWKYDPTLKQELWYGQEPVDYPVASGLANRLIGQLMAAGFDPAHSRYMRDDQAMSHSFAYVYRRMMPEKPFASIPVSINTYYPPNNLHPLRAYRLGEAIRAAIEAWPEDLRVAVVATGGLSHFVVDEAFDRAFIEIMRNGTAEDHANLPLEKLQSGNSEFRCWSALAGAVQGMEMALIDYVPCYRSLAGTGCGMTFAAWR